MSKEEKIMLIGGAVILLTWVIASILIINAVFKINTDEVGRGIGSFIGEIKRGIEQGGGDE